LREAQAAALPLLLEGEQEGGQDVVIAAAAASGKTEAAFLPLLTRLWQGEGKGLMLYGGMHPKPHGRLHRALAKRFAFSIYYDLGKKR